MKSFIKWVGGKSRFIKNIHMFPRDYHTYYEPFVGAGCVLLALQPKRAVISDVNPELITAWRVLQCNAEGLIKKLLDMQSRFSEDYYYEMRSVDLSRLSPLEIAARFIFLNKTGYNGLYRVNMKGQFNVPCGNTGRIDKTTGGFVPPVVCDPDALRAIHKYLSTAKVSIECRPFEWIERSVIKNDLVYMDPPYIESYVGYTPFSFGTEEHTKLADLCSRLVKKKARVALSNSLTDKSLELVPNGWNTHEIKTNRSVSRKASTRGSKTELLATSW